jgi:hypothetical protein
MSVQSWERVSYIVTVIGLPFAIAVYMLERRKERQIEEEEIYQKLSDEYADFSKLLLENADLRLTSAELPEHQLSPEQQERKKVIFDILIALFERAFILVYEERMSPQTKRLWSTWDDYIRTWCKREDFCKALPRLLEGEDPDFGHYIRRIAEQTARLARPAAPAP